MSESKRIRELEMEVESYRYAAQRLAEELVSILVPYRAKDPVACAAAMERIAAEHPDPGFGKAVH